jgi:hypothetical protein
MFSSSTKWCLILGLVAALSSPDVASAQRFRRTLPGKPAPAPLNPAVRNFSTPFSNSFYYNPYYAPYYTPFYNPYPNFVPYYAPYYSPYLALPYPGPYLNVPYDPYGYYFNPYFLP